jgi:hypothetical protein
MQSCRLKRETADRSPILTDMRKFIILASSILLLLGVILTALDIGYSYSLSRHPLLKIPKHERFDYLIIGDSRVSSILEKQLDSLTGRRCLVLANYGGNLDDMPFVIDYFFQNGNTARTVISSIDLRIGGNEGVKHEWLYYAHTSRKNGYLGLKFPFLIYARNNTTVTTKRIFEDLFKDVDSSRKDQRNMNILQWYEPHKDQMKDYSLNPLRIESLVNLKNILKAHGVSDHRLLIAPLSPEFDALQSDPDGYKSLLRDNGFRYYDFSAQFTDTSGFADLVHLKRKAYVDFTAAVADSITSGR